MLVSADIDSNPKLFLIEMIEDTLSILSTDIVLLLALVYFGR